MTRRSVCSLLVAAVLAAALWSGGARAAGAAAGLPQLPENQTDAPIQIIPPPPGSHKPIIVPMGPDAALGLPPPAVPVTPVERRALPEGAAEAPAAAPAPAPAESPYARYPEIRHVVPAREMGLRIVAVVNDQLVVSVDGATRYLKTGDRLAYGSTLYRVEDGPHGARLQPVRGPGRPIEFRLPSRRVIARGPNS